jgi:hypothetical protein
MTYQPLDPLQMPISPAYKTAIALRRGQKLNENQS